ncbi:class I SAM-dependent methyltransferase [Pseudobdellovibrio exovorus]|uniref:Methyltransferase n=1 Tax=Pseudobdellovibrio exovorus JSS TaxID=1184267 RepID=M4V9K9_9BACT|nr:class I SAM-dependent methyltransferase [Pseudobdellovibrio exovorus]AGH95903.1 methyltransferase [Pseudobdellovibrio exovorus JSS]
MTYNKYHGISDIMQLRYTEHENFLAFDKPYDFRTHQVADGQFGFVEHVAEKLSKSLFVVHRLDKGTSGLILFATTKEAAANISQLFEKHLIKKTYYFLTHASLAEHQFTINSHIEKQNGTYFNIEDKEANSETEFQFIQAVGTNFLWAAKPKTGKPHQIRLHAEKAGIPILGDAEHGGRPFHRLALHAKELKFTLDGKTFEVTSELPPIFQKEFNTTLEALLYENWHKRQILYHIPENESYRLLHLESTDIRADVFSERLWVYDYTHDGITSEEQDAIQSFSKEKNLQPIIRHMLNRGQGVGGLEQSTLHNSSANTNWVAQEESVCYHLRTDSGFSPGLFLDQRENRIWVKQNSSNKSVLNLFCYTSGFSVNAALGKAKQVTSVDVSAKFLNWSRENFQLNEIDPQKHEFFAQDSLVFLKGSVKRGRKWDLIICDPPSFGRSKESVWKLERDLPELASSLIQCLNKNGKILFTCNLEKKTRQDIIQLFQKGLKNKKQWNFDRLPLLSLDYELTDDRVNLMKGFFVLQSQ